MASTNHKIMKMHRTRVLDSIEYIQVIIGLVVNYSDSVCKWPNVNIPFIQYHSIFIVSYACNLAMPPSYTYVRV